MQSRKNENDYMHTYLRSSGFCNHAQTIFCRCVDVVIINRAIKLLNLATIHNPDLNILSKNFTDSKESASSNKIDRTKFHVSLMKVSHN